MPVYTLQCPDCDHRFMGMVMAHTKPPREWVCSICGGRRARPEPGTKPRPHPWEQHNAEGGCLCCGVSGRVNSGKNNRPSRNKGPRDHGRQNDLGRPRHGLDHRAVVGPD